MNDSELFAFAKKAAERAYAPYSSFTVGAALLTKDGKVYCGCNIENAAFSPTNCAERTAFFKAVSEGEREFSAIAVAGGKNLNFEENCFPCGVCRQVMCEFCHGDFRVIVGNDREGIRVFTLGELLPESFGLIGKNED